MRLSLGAFLIIGLPIGIASAAEFHKVATPNLPPPVSVGTPVKFKRNVVATCSQRKGPAVSDGPLVAIKYQQGNE